MTAAQKHTKKPTKNVVLTAKSKRDEKREKAKRKALNKGKDHPRRKEKTGDAFSAGALHLEHC